jgi:hypothetical protein
MSRPSQSPWFYFHSSVRWMIANFVIIQSVSALLSYRPTGAAVSGTRVAAPLRCRAKEELLWSIILGSSTITQRERLNQWPGSILILQPKELKTMQSSRKIMATVFWNVHRVLLVEFTSPGWTSNAAACHEALKTLQDAVLRKRQGLLTKRVLLHDSVRLHSAAVTMNPWTPGSGKFFHNDHTVLIWHRRISISYKRWKSMSGFSGFSSMNIFKM